MHFFSEKKILLVSQKRNRQVHVLSNLRLVNLPAQNCLSKKWFLSEHKNGKKRTAIQKKKAEQTLPSLADLGARIPSGVKLSCSRGRCNRLPACRCVWWVLPSRSQFAPADCSYRDPRAPLALLCSPAWVLVRRTLVPASGSLLTNSCNFFFAVGTLFF